MGLKFLLNFEYATATSRYLWYFDLRKGRKFQLEETEWLRKGLDVKITTARRGMRNRDTT
jgi:hypothetical protein